MTKPLYIEVSVCLPVMKTYTYSVPEHFQTICFLGMRVLVPFKRRKVTGYIISIQESCEGFKAKKILDVLDEYPLFPESQISFFKWISQYYIHALGQVIKTALPSSLNLHDISYVFVTEYGEKCMKEQKLTPGEAQILESISKRKSCSLKQLTRNYKNASALVYRMKNQGLLKVSSVLKKDGTSIKKEKFILQKNDVPKTNIRMSEKRKKILSLIKDKKEISLTQLKTYIPRALTLIKPLEKAGFIKIIEKQILKDPLGEPVEQDSFFDLTQEQKQVLKEVKNNIDKGFQPYLLFGVTSSGKTEVYMKLIEFVINKGKNAIVLVPEISLISQTERRFKARFKDIAVIHSRLSKNELFMQWQKIVLKKVKIVIGARSAIFAPFENIGIIIVDEEHDLSYKQETGLRYNARDIAVVRAKMNNCLVVLGSATPSLQSYQNVITKKFKELKLENRFNENPLPKISLIDLKKYKSNRGYDRIITPELSQKIRDCLDKGNQALIFLNRRGFATFPVCHDCGKALLCKHCDITLTSHQQTNEYHCHLCGYKMLISTKCPDCSSKKIKALGFGTQKVHDILKNLFPDARIARMDQDSTSKKNSLIKLLKDIRNKNTDIIVGTQMLAKGHDFPDITLVGIICADLSLSLPDFRAGERTFQLLAQVAGRAGRGDMKGEVIMQTYNPDHFIIETAQKQNFIEFFNNEVPFRKALMYPPFSRMVQLKISSNKNEAARKYAFDLVNILKTLIADYSDNQSKKTQLLGPAQAAIQKISSRFRWQILIKSPSSVFLNYLIKNMTIHPVAKPKSGIRLIIDVDPYSLM